MKLFARWCRFNAVGVMGMAVQLTALAILNRCTPGHYLVATAEALEITLVHNFLWHQRYTWRDRRHASAAAVQFLKFHLSNGMVSLIGNLGLMRILVSEMRTPVLVADSIAILVCSLANFGLGSTWVFAPGTRENVACRDGPDSAAELAS
jgi:putative flippase GtrA